MRVGPFALALSSCLFLGCASPGPAPQTTAELEDIPLFFRLGGSRRASSPECDWATLGLIEVRVNSSTPWRRTERILQSAARSRRAQAIIELVREGEVWSGEVIEFTDPDCKH